MALHVQLRGHAGLVLELGQRGAQRRLNVFLAGAGAKVHQQLAHIGIALAHAHVQLGHAAVAGGGVVLGHRVVQQLRLNFQKCQRLGNGVVQLARQQAALFGHGSLALQRRRAQPLHAAGQVAHHGL